MNFSRFRKVLAFMTALILLPVAWFVQADQLDSALECTREAQRLDRLACFDRVFKTPLELAGAETKTDAKLVINHSERWRQAFAQAGDQQTVSYRDTGSVAGHLVTVPALGARPPRPLLVLQCHNNITELSLMLPEALDAERVSIEFGAGLADWRVRDNGFLVSGGRGLPAIHMVKAMVFASDIRLEANQPVLNGLMFDLSGFSEAIQPLRSACGW